MMIPESEISEFPEYHSKSKIGNILVNEKNREEHCVYEIDEILIFSQIYKTDPCFYEHYEKKIKVDGNGRNYVLFRIDVYFSQCNLAVKFDEKGYTDIYLVAENKRQEALEKKLGCKVIRINTSKEGYDENYETDRIQTFIGKLQWNRQLKK